MPTETTFTLDTSSVKYGPGATREVGHDMRQWGAKRVMVVTDPRLRDSEPVQLALASLRAEGLDAVLYDGVRVEPTDHSMQEAIGFAADGRFDGFVPVGGGSSIDTAKVANLYSTYPAEVLTYVNAPIGRAEPIPGRLKPLIAIPTTAGTGSETTGVAIFDLEEMHAKTGIAHRALRPVMGIVDPNNTRTLPPLVAASTGWDVLCHAIESLTALPFQQRPAPEHPGLRPAYQGANPISDIWAAQAIEKAARHIVRVYQDPTDEEARATFAGIGFGNAGVHLPHGMSYPISGLAKAFVPAGYPGDHSIIPHGMSVVLSAPAVFRWTAVANPERHLRAAALMGVDTRGAAPMDAGQVLAGAVIELMKRTGMPNGLAAVGYGPQDVDKLVAGTLPQHRVTKLSPRPVTAEDLKQLFLDSMQLW